MRRMIVRTGAVAALAASWLSGCAGTRIMTPAIDPSIQAASQQRARQPIPASRRTPRSDQIGLVGRIDGRLRPAAIRVCQRSFGTPEGCRAAFGSRTLDVRVSDSRINAFVGDKYDVVLLGGLVSHAGSDDEIAAVLAHEYSHALLRHPQKTQMNRLGGLLIGAAIGAAVGAKTDDPDLADLGARAGFEAGNLVFSRSMELEADHLGMFILHEAGYDVSAASHFHIRMMKLAARGSSTGAKGFLGFISTHPSPERRIDKIIATERLIQNGATSPRWKEQ